MTSLQCSWSSAGSGNSRAGGSGNPFASSHLRPDILRIALLALVYFGAAQLGLLLAFSQGNVSPLWPAAGLALAALVLFGERLWPGVFLGAFLANLSTEVQPWVAALIGAGNTLAALAAVAMLRRIPGFQTSLNRLTDVLGLTAVSLLAPALSATIGIGSLYLGGATEGRGLGALWRTWWSGDLLGTLIVAPLILVWSSPVSRRLSRAQIGEVLAMVLVVGGTSAVIYHGDLLPPSFVYPLLLWPALRYGLRGGVIATAVLAVTAVWATTLDQGPLVGTTAEQTFGNLQLVLCVSMIVTMVVGAVTAERKRVQAAWQEASESLRSLIEAAPVAIVACDFKGMTTRWNAAAERIFGFSAEEVIGRPLPHIPPERSAEFARLCEEQLAGQSLIGLETVRRRKDGSLVEVSVSVAPMRDANGRVSGSMGVLTDISERKRAEEALEQSRRTYEDLVDSIDGIVWEADATTLACTFVSRQPERLTGYPRSRWLEPDFWRNRVHPDDREAVAAYCASQIALGLNHSIEYRFMAADGGVLWMRDLVTVVVENGVPTRLRGVTFDITERKRVEATIEEGNRRLRGIVDSALDAVITIDEQGLVTGWDGQAQAVFGWSRDEMIGRSLADTIIPPQHRDGHRDGMARFLATGEHAILGRRVEMAALHRTGREFPVELAVSSIRVGDRHIFSAFVRDITGRKVSERALQETGAQLRQAQKMEAVGQLAGGVAHDFNNLLTSIIGHAELMLDELPSRDRLRADLVEIHRAANRAARLTSQLLAFSRKQVIEPKVLDLNAAVEGVAGMLRRLIGEHIEIVTEFQPRLWGVLVDPGQLEQVIVNLAVNARDAMMEGGRLRIETSNVVLGEDFLRDHPGSAAGPHVLLAVHDEGLGMDPETQAHIFEPFFTTKDKAKGTGLGLATVYGIVKQSRGYVGVESARGRGTSMRVYLPKAADTGDAPPVAVQEPPAEGTGTILLVEDEEALRRLTRRILVRAGYFVLDARDAEEAIRLSQEHQEPIDLLLTDVIMAGGSGPRLADALRPLRPKMRVLYMSGYSDEEIVQQGVLQPGVEYLQKPFTIGTLTRKVREVMQRPAPRSAKGSNATG
ncbi:MAG: PAS domain S-box protein [Gemmatimonadales bacterium]